MAVPHATPGEVVDVRPLGAALATTVTKTLVKTETVTLFRSGGKRGSIYTVRLPTSSSC